MNMKQAQDYGDTYEKLHRVLDECGLNRAERMGVLYLVLSDEVRGAQNEMYGNGKQVVDAGAQAAN